MADLWFFYVRGENDMADQTTGTVRLSFGSGHDYWSIAESGDWTRDHQAGRAAGAELIRTIMLERAPYLMGYVMRDMLAHARWGAIEIGFADALGEDV